MSCKRLGLRKKAGLKFQSNVSSSPPLLCGKLFNTGGKTRSRGFILTMSSFQVSVGLGILVDRSET